MTFLEELIQKKVIDKVWRQRPLIFASELTQIQVHARVQARIDIQVMNQVGNQVWNQVGNQAWENTL